MAAAAVLIVIVALMWRGWSAVALAGLVVAGPPLRAVLAGASGKQLIPVLGATGRVQLAVGLLLALGLALGPTS
jgi:1,4-dihydroxy-2-naphthoate octaprenyltransferase